jgi:VCBS repeat-containing protein
VASGESYGTDEDLPLTVAASGVLGNDTDADPGDSLRAELVSEPTHGTLTLDADGSFTYLPAADYHGPDSFPYRAHDEHGATSATVSVTLTVNPLSDAPTAGDDAYTTTEDTSLTVSAPGVLGSDDDADGDDLGAVLVSGPTHGTLTLDADGSFDYAPAPDYHGPDSFTYRARDGHGAESAVATVALTVDEFVDTAGPQAHPRVSPAPQHRRLAPRQSHRHGELDRRGRRGRPRRLHRSDDERWSGSDRADRELPGSRRQRVHRQPGRSRRHDRPHGEPHHFRRGTVPAEVRGARRVPLQ